MKRQYDTIVVGAGSVGVPITYFLAKKGCDVLCVDSNASSGQGQNKAAIGGVRATHSDPAKIKICQKSLEIFSNWEKEHGDDIGWKKGGYCFPVYRKQEEETLKGILPEQKKFDLNIDWIGAEKLKKIVPGINPSGLIGGTYSPDDGQVSPLLAMEAMTRAAQQLGATFLFGTKVEKFVRKRNKISEIKTDKGVFKANVTVNASGANARELGKTANLDLPVYPDSHEAGISAPVKEFLDPLVVDLRPGKEGKTVNFYFGQNHEKAFIFCYTPKELFKGKDRRTTSEFMPVISNRLVELIPRLRNLTIRRVWRGLYPMTPDGVAIVGKAPETENHYLAVGMCGQGFMMGPGVGYQLASLIKNGEPEMDNEVFNTLSPARDFDKEGTEALK